VRTAFAEAVEGASGPGVTGMMPGPERVEVIGVLQFSLPVTAPQNSVLLQCVLLPPLLGQEEAIRRIEAS
jgi:hypothetical protein